MYNTYRFGRNSMNCTRCNGLGYIGKYAHIMDGRCFHCLGTGKEPENEYATKKEIKKGTKQIIEVNPIDNQTEIQAKQIRDNIDQISITIHGDNRKIRELETLIKNNNISNEAVEVAKNKIEQLKIEVEKNKKEHEKLMQTLTNMGKYYWK